jgi:hypothetical protein
VISLTNQFIDQITKESLDLICDIEEPPEHLQDVVKCVMKILKKKNSWSYAVKIISKD